MAEVDKIDTGKVQSFFQALPSSVQESDPLLSIFKRVELESTMSSAATGAYYTYWTVDKIADLNNLVDAAPSCHQKLKDLFNGGSRNPRIRGNRIGQLVFSHIKELMESGVGSDDCGPATSVSGSSSAPLAGQTATKPAVDRMLDGKSLTRYLFSPDLPMECQLRVRNAPSMEGDAVGVVTAVDEIMGSPSVMQGEWLRVQVSGWEFEAWMLTNMGGQQLLIAERAGGTQAAAPPAVPVYSQPAPAPAPTPASMTLSASSQMMSASTAMGMPSIAPSVAPGAVSMTSMTNPLSQSMALQSAMNMSMTQHGRPATAPVTPSRESGYNTYGHAALSSTMMPTDHSMDGQMVPYELFRRLEVRVNHLEVELNSLKMALRSV